MARIINKLSGPTTQHHTGKRRILSVDSMRGTAMVLVILQHCCQVANPGLVSSLMDSLIYLPTRMASVAFMVVSGMMISYFLYTSTDQGAVYRRFAKRALLLLLGAHTAIHIVRFFYYDPVGLPSLLHHIAWDYLIVDTIAVALLIAPLIIRYTSLTARAVLVVALLAATPLFLIYYQPAPGLGLAVRNVLFGGEAGQVPIFVGWPLVPWIAIFLCGSFVAHALARVKQGEMPVTLLISRMRKAGVYLIIIGLILTVSYKLFKTWLGAPDPIIFNAIYPSRTTTLLPIYLGVLLWIFSYLMQLVDLRGRHNWLTWALSVFGRTSLFTYVTQFIFVHTLPAFLGLKWKLSVSECFALFLFALPASWLLSYSYGRFRGWISHGEYAKSQVASPLAEQDIVAR